MKVVLESLLIFGVVLGSFIGLISLNYLVAPAFFEQNHNQPFTNMPTIQVPILHIELNTIRMSQASFLLFCEIIFSVIFVLIYITRQGYGE